MRGNKFENSYIHILEPETLSRESRVTESAQEIVDSTPYNSQHSRPISTFFKFFTLLELRCILQELGRLWRVSDL